MNKFIIEITEPAESDLKNIRLYIEEELLEPNTAIKIIDEIGESIISWVERLYNKKMTPKEISESTTLPLETVNKIIKGLSKK